ncbi:putative reverse transcriptase domain-containing protein [Tanacetum coccineum]|uniref:Reverse transcriptase domain-containing protein n=1 Tax=Tanacetum coccineum TaxID=301880 RepID=A0ABQ5EB81_9ASTR
MDILIQCLTKVDNNCEWRKCGTQGEGLGAQRELDRQEWKRARSTLELVQFFQSRDHQLRCSDTWILRRLRLSYWSALTYDQTEKNKKYEWGTEEDEAFQTLKQKLCSAPILALPEGTENFVVYCDASHKGRGAARCRWKRKSLQEAMGNSTRSEHRLPPRDKMVQSKKTIQTLAAPFELYMGPKVRYTILQGVKFEDSHSHGPNRSERQQKRLFKSRIGWSNCQKLSEKLCGY